LSLGAANNVHDRNGEKASIWGRLKSCTDTFIAELRSTDEGVGPYLACASGGQTIAQQVMNSRAEFQVSSGEWL